MALRRPAVRLSAVARAGTSHARARRWPGASSTTSCTTRARRPKPAIAIVRAGAPESWALMDAASAARGCVPMRRMDDRLHFDEHRAKAIANIASCDGGAWVRTDAADGRSAALR
jgi:hypothetical protein